MLLNSRFSGFVGSLCVNYMLRWIGCLRDWAMGVGLLNKMADMFITVLSKSVLPM